jgi:hypothetical protein
MATAKHSPKPRPLNRPRTPREYLDYLAALEARRGSLLRRADRLFGKMREIAHEADDKGFLTLADLQALSSERFWIGAIVDRPRLEKLYRAAGLTPTGRERAGGR